MENEFEKNFSDDGYIMNYRKLDKLVNHRKNELLQFKIEGYIYREKKTKYPICIEGERACPPEDCGGERGYNDMLNILFDPKNERHEEMKIWVGEDWDAEVFDSKNVSFTDPYKRWKKGFLS